MPHTDLRTAAARHFLGTSNTQYLVDVAHAALDRGIYARGLGEIATDRQPIFSNVRPHFDSALMELGIQVGTWEQALDILTESYMVSIAEGVCTPREAVDEAHADYNALLFGDRGKVRERDSFGAFATLAEQHYQYDYYAAGPETFAQLDRDCIILAEKWCRERWRPILDPTWLTSDVLALARGIYDERAFDRMPILADALQDAGCDNEDILNHCRDEKATHVRGCWVVDLLLGKV